MDNILYSAVVLDADSHGKLAHFGVPGWKTFCHHMTIVFGSGLPSHLRDDLGKVVTITATHIGRSDKAVAVRVSGFHSNNDIPHVTVAVNFDGGGRPVDSNSITDWKPLDNPISLTGTVSEIPRAPKQGRG
jgi:hypothetical protein